MLPSRPFAPAPQAPLASLFEDLTTARREVVRLRHSCAEPRRVLEARRALLSAMESYAAALTERGLPTPWKLRDDLRLHRSIGTPGASPGGRR